jgi:hypothetical protein
MPVATGTRTIHRYKINPDSSGVAQVDVLGLDPVLRSIDTDLSADISAWFEVTTVESGPTKPFRFAVIPTGGTVPAEGAYLNRALVGSPFGPLIMHCYALPTD